MIGVCLLSLALASSLLAVGSLHSGGAEELDFYIGTYTSKEGSRGIYHARLNVHTGAISQPELAIESDSPSYLALHPGGRFLYAVHESSDGEVSAYAIGPGKKLRLLDTQTSKGAGPCHLSVDAGGKNVLSANYTSGSIACFPVHADGSIAPASCVIQNTGSGPNKERQDHPYMHSIFSDAKSRFVYACDLGTDEVRVYHFDPAKGELEPSTPVAGLVPPGSGPRHLVLHPSGKTMYVNNEMGNSVSVFAVDPTTGALTRLQTIGTLPGNETNTTAEILCHPSGKWVYVTNRGHDSIAVFKTGSDGRLTLVEIQPAGVKEPRGAGIDPTGKWIVVAGQNSNDLTTLSVDPSSGKLHPTSSKVSLSMPVCVVFSKS